MIFLVRHAAGRHNETKDYDNPDFVDALLTVKGKEQAKSLRTNEELKNPDFVISSPLSRAFETACLGFPESNIIIDPLCREKCMFMCDRLRSEVIPGIMSEETDEELMIRAKIFVDKLRQTKFQKLIVVTHGKFINAMLSAVAGKTEIGPTKYYKNIEIVKIHVL
jgi:broad specificity phosphatase PhoE